MKRNLIKGLLLLLFVLISSNLSAGNVTFVNAFAHGLNNGSSWENAYNDLQLALNDPRSSEIWVAEGIYTPIDPVSDETNGFYIDGFGAYGVVLGGFNGTETSVDERNPEDNLTLLVQNNKRQSDKISVIFSTSKRNEITFNGFTISTLLGDEPELVKEITVNTRLVNCRIGSELVNNTEEINDLSNNHNRLKSLDDDLFFNHQNPEEITFAVYPTIATSQITIETSVPSVVDLINYLGSVVFTADITTSPLRINVSDLPKGIYIAKVRNASVGIKTARVVVK